MVKWKDAKGNTRTAPLTTGQDGTDRLLIESPYFVPQYRDGVGQLQVVPTGCRDEQAARQVLAELERRAELVKAGVMTADEDRIGQHRDTPLEEHFGAYLAHLETKEACKEHRAERGRQL